MALRLQQMILLALLCGVCIDMVTAAITDVVKPNAGRRKKRSLWNFSGMIDCGIKEVNSRIGATARYGNYGCHCGVGGKGKTLDNIDKCCKDHDSCYGAVENRGCWPKTDNYGWSCKKSKPKCTKKGSWWSGGNNDCEWRICECDRKIVDCFKKHNHEYNVAYLTYTLLGLKC